MSGELIWVQGNDGRMRQVIDLPDVCGAGHQGAVWYQQSWCPQCNRPSGVFRCDQSGCHWAAATQAHYDRQCTPDAPVWRAQPRGSSG